MNGVYEWGARRRLLDCKLKINLSIEWRQKWDSRAQFLIKLDPFISPKHARAAGEFMPQAEKNSLRFRALKIYMDYNHSFSIQKADV